MEESRSRDLKLLAEVLRSIWRQYSNRVIAAVLVVGFTVGGMVLGSLWASRDVLARTSGVVDTLQREIEHNRDTIRMLEERQSRLDRRYRDLVIVLDGVRKGGGK
jgi:hypothetical protein